MREHGISGVRCEFDFASRVSVFPCRLRLDEVSWTTPGSRSLEGAFGPPSPCVDGLVTCDHAWPCLSHGDREDAMLRRRRGIDGHGRRCMSDQDRGRLSLPDRELVRRDANGRTANCRRIRKPRCYPCSADFGAHTSKVPGASAPRPIRFPALARLSRLPSSEPFHSLLRLPWCWTACALECSPVLQRQNPRHKTHPAGMPRGDRRRHRVDRTRSRERSLPELDDKPVYGHPHQLGKGTFNVRYYLTSLSCAALLSLQACQSGTEPTPPASTRTDSTKTDSSSTTSGHASHHQ